MIGWITVTITISIFVLAHIIATVWWASRVDTLLNVAQKSLDTLILELKSIRLTTQSKEEAARESAINNKEHETMWKKIDNMQEKILQTHGGK